MLMTENEDVHAVSPELLRELGRVKAGVLTAFVPSMDAVDKIGGIVREIAMSLGMRIESQVLATDYAPLQWSLGVRRVSALDPERPRYSLVRFNDAGNPLEVGSYLRAKLFDIIDDSPTQVEYYQPVNKRFSRVDFLRRREIFDDRSLAADDDDIEFCGDLPGSIGFKPNEESIIATNESESCFSLGLSVSFDEDQSDFELDREKKQWVDALSALIVQYMTRFHEAPPMEMIEASVRGKILLSASHKSPLTVSGDMKIYLPELNEIQLRMTPLATTVYILFLCHPEGIRLKDIADYRHELTEIYSMVKPGASEAMASASIDELVNPMGNSLNEKLSMIRRSVKRYILDKQMAEHYVIKGRRGELYRIALYPQLIHLPQSLKSLTAKT